MRLAGHVDMVRWSANRGPVTALDGEAMVLDILLPAAAWPQQPSASGAACDWPESREFDFWIGEWEVLNRHRAQGQDDPTWYQTGMATDRVFAAVGGCATVERWYGKLSFDEIVGFSVRAFDPATAQWSLVLLWPGRNRPVFGTLKGGFRHHRGEFFTEGADAQGRAVLSRFTFSDIRPDALRWDAAVSHDSGLTWRSNWIMEFTRRAPEAGPLPDPMADGVRRCDTPEVYEFDFALGDWQGIATLQDGSSAPITLRSESILKGCGVLDLIAVGDRWEGLEVRTFDPTIDAWVAYRLDTDHPVFHRLEGRVRGREAELLGTRGVADVPTMVRSRWEWLGASRMRLALTESADGGATWRVTFEAELEPVPSSWQP
jgi:hypothetical protein